MTDTSIAGGAPADASTPQLSADEAKAKGDDLVRQSVKAEDSFEARRLSDEAQKFYSIATGGRMVGAKEPPADGATKQQQPLAPAAADDKPIDRARGEAILQECTGGALTFEQFEMVCRDSGPWARELEMTLADKGQGAYRAAIEKGEATVVRDIYRGNVDAMHEGLGEIVDAVNQAFGARASTVLQLIDENATLVNAKAHEQILTWARATLR